jgi:hypothetical protein
MGHFAVKESIAIGLEAALRLGDWARAEAILGVVRAEPAGRRRTFYRAHAAWTEARLPDRSDEEAEHLFQEAIQAFREIRTPFPLAVALLGFGGWLRERGRASDAKPLLAESRAVFEGLGAAPWLERVDLVGQDVLTS